MNDYLLGIKKQLKKSHINDWGGLLRYRSLEILTLNLLQKMGAKNNVEFRQRVSRLCKILQSFILNTIFKQKWGKIKKC
uniref:Uncharacterized protein n=1 Tax=Panagrolaimus sp. ES5 TaxID=591445 RepID=A0AC34F3B9_9BILA